MRRRRQRAATAPEEGARVVEGQGDRPKRRPRRALQEAGGDDEGRSKHGRGREAREPGQRAADTPGRDAVEDKLDGADDEVGNSEQEPAVRKGSRYGERGQE